MGRSPCCDKAKVKRGPWSPEEDAALKQYLQTHGSAGNWIALPHKAGLKRCGKSCRLRWLNYLRPDIKHGGFTEEEDKVIFTLYSQMGSRWSLIASHLPGRTDNDVKNYWNTKLKKKLFGGKTSPSINTTTSTNDNITPPNYKINHIAPSPCLLSMPCVPIPKTETSSSLTFWDSLPESSETLPVLSNVGYDPIHIHDYSFPPAGIMDVSQEAGSGMNSDSSSNITMDYNNKCLISFPSNDTGLIHEEVAEILMESGFNFQYDDPVNSLLFEDKSSDNIAPSCSPNLGSIGYAAADIKQQGQKQCY